MVKSKSNGRWSDRYFTSADGIRLHYRDYDGPRDGPPILCIPGLTRNARDFELLADRYAGEWRVLVVDLRGRGLSDPDPQPERYAPHYYLADLIKLLDQLGIADVVFIGTSLGGLVTMLVAAAEPERIAGALLNDIGPEIDRQGLEFIGGYVGKDERFGDWAAAASELGRRHANRFPTYTPSDWEEMARRWCVEDGGEIRFDYDMRIADNFKRAMDAEPVDAWPMLDGLKGKPVTIVRGAHSDLMSSETAERMARELPGAELVTVPDASHAPSLDEPESVAAIDRLLARVRAEAG